MELVSTEIIICNVCGLWYRTECKLGDTCACGSKDFIHSSRRLKPMLTDAQARAYILAHSSREAANAQICLRAQRRKPPRKFDAKSLLGKI